MQLTAEEKTNGALTPEHLTLALRTLRDVGYVVIEDVYDLDYIAAFRAAYDEELERYLAARGGIEALNKKTFGRNHIGLHLPFVAPFSDPEIVANPIAVQVMGAALGDDLRCGFYHSNTAYPGSNHQQIHRDTGPMFRTELQVPTPITHIVLNIPLTTFTEENGSTEVWPGTHLIVDTAAEDGSAEALEDRAQYLASQRTNVPVGSLVIRDLRMWHRGMPNESDEVRTMLAIVYQRSWLAHGRPLEIPRETWKGWPDVARRIFGHNRIVDTVEEMTVPQNY